MSAASVVNEIMDCLEAGWILRPFEPLDRQRILCRL